VQLQIKELNMSFFSHKKRHFVLPLAKPLFLNMKISKTPKSRIDTVDFTDLPFGKYFSDHMLVCHFKNGAWQEPEILPYGNVSLSYSLHALHYGQAAFEGLKAYKTNDGGAAIFRPKANFDRLNRSAERLLMPQVPEKIFMDGLLQLIKLDEKWVPTTDDHALYIRPFLFSSSEFIAARPSDDFTFVILTSPVGPYYPGSVKVKIEDHYTRAATGGIGYTKAAGNYGGAFYPTSKAIEQGFKQVIWTDHREHKFIEESGTMNIMLRIEDKLLTPPLSDRILAGITRDSILTLRRDWNMDVEERPISVDEVVEAAKKGKLIEAFGMGTAAVVSTINGIGYKDQIFEVSTPSDGFAMKIKKGLTDIRQGTAEDKYGWMVKVL
jgi:branched-chain amino acid aminotransferase